MKILKIADFYGSVQQRLSIDGRVFQIGVNVGGLEFHDDGAQAVIKSICRSNIRYHLCLFLQNFLIILRIIAFISFHFETPIRIFNLSSKLF